MSAPLHTEKWKLEETSSHWNENMGLFSIKNEGGGERAGVYFDKRDGNMRTSAMLIGIRIVECFNACHGLVYPEDVIRAMRAVKAEDLSAEAIGKLKQERDQLKEKVEANGVWHAKYIGCRNELEDIRKFLNADENESTYDEVERRITKLEKQRDHFIEVFNLIHQTCESVLNNRAMKESELRNTLKVLKVIANKEKGRLDGSFIQTDEQRAHADRIFNEMKGGQP